MGVRRADPGRAARSRRRHPSRRPHHSARRGTDETGHAYVRSFTRIDETIHVTGAPEVEQTCAEVMFQEIVYDGLIGDASCGASSSRATSRARA
jgi:hypothetical protein